MDIADVRRTFGGKYEKGIQQMLDYIEKSPDIAALNRNSALKVSDFAHAAGGLPVIFPVEPYTGAGPVRLGMRVGDIEAALGQQAVLADKGGEGPVATFPSVGVHAEIAAGGCCTAIELRPPAAPVLGDHLLPGPPSAGVRAHLGTLDAGLQEDGSGLTCERLGVRLYDPMAADDMRRPAEGVTVFERDYCQEQG
jgi:hypothetical protein